MTAGQRVEAQWRPNPPLQPKARWAPTTVLGSAVALVLPFNSLLPTVPRAIWFVGIVALIGVPIFRRVGLRPLYSAVWAYAGYASFVAILTATKEGTIAENLFVGAQLVLLVGFGPFAMTANAVIDPKFAQRVSVAYLLGQTLSAITSVAQLLGQSFLGSAPLQGRAYGLSEHPNTFGLLSCVAVLIALQMLLTARRFRLLAFVALAANVIGLIASGSVSSMMALAVGLPVLIISRRDHLGRMTVGAIACAIALWLIGTFSGIFSYLPSVARRYGQVTGQTESVSSWELRTLTYKFAWERISDEPIFGVGLHAQYSGTFNGITVTHNIFLRAWYQGGILLGIALGLVVVVVLIASFRAMISKHHGGEASVLVALFAFALTSASFEQRQFWLPVLVAWGSISAAAIRQKLASDDTPPLNRGRHSRSNMAGKLHAIGPADSAPGPSVRSRAP